MITHQITIDDCEIIGCEDCIGSFAPIPGREYVLSAWVSEDNLEGKLTLSSPRVILSFTGLGMSLPPIAASGPIIDGWQRIEYAFTVPVGATGIMIDLANVGSEESYFDDVRIHPIDANMKSFVYDPLTMRIMAQLDQQNYATFYEYDEEGNLVRTKRETVRGVQTQNENYTHFNK